MCFGSRYEQAARRLEARGLSYHDPSKSKRVGQERVGGLGLADSV